MNGVFTLSLALILLVAGVYLLGRKDKAADSEKTKTQAGPEAAGGNATGNPATPSLLIPIREPGTPARTARESKATTDAPPTSGTVPEVGAESSAIEAILFELEELAMHEDAASLEKILARFSHPSREVRLGATEAVEQFGDRGAVPALNRIAARTKNPAEKARILEAVEFLMLPSLSELISDDGKLNLDAGEDAEPGEPDRKESQGPAPE